MLERVRAALSDSANQDECPHSFFVEGKKERGEDASRSVMELQFFTPSEVNTLNVTFDQGS